MKHLLLTSAQTLSLKRDLSPHRSSGRADHQPQRPAGGLRPFICDTEGLDSDAAAAVACPETKHSE